MKSVRRIFNALAYMRHLKIKINLSNNKIERHHNGRPYSHHSVGSSYYTRVELGSLGEGGGYSIGIIHMRNH